MSRSRTIVLEQPPAPRGQYLRAALSAVPMPGPLSRRSHGLPDRTAELTGLRVDPDNLSDYARACGLRFGDTLPITYPFTLTFPIVLELIIARDFPFSAVGAVHAENLITQLRPISVGEPLDVRARTANLREHPKGLLVDAISEISVGREPVWHQVTTFLHQQRTSLSGGPRPAAKPEEAPPPPLRQLRVDQATIDRYAAASGDRNPIHTSALGARAFGFPTTIAHGMWEAAAVLAAVEGRIPDKVRYQVKFGKPVLLPATLNLYADRVDTGGESGWDLALRHPTKGYPHLTGTLRAG